VNSTSYPTEPSGEPERSEPNQSGTAGEGGGHGCTAAPVVLDIGQRYYWLLLAEGHLDRRRFGAMLDRISLLPVPTE
jgi:beta-xylosidase